MPSPLTPGVRALLGLWGPIASSAAQHLTTQDLWRTVRTAAADSGLTLAGVTIQDMNYVRSAANKTLQAQAALGRATPTQALDATMMAQSPWSPFTAASAAAPTWMVRYEALFDTEEGPVSQWMTSSYDLTNLLPQTVGDLTSDLADDAALNVSTSSPPCGGQLTGIGSTQIMIM